MVSRIMVEASMNAAEKSCEQRKRVRAVIELEKEIAASANEVWTSSLAVSRQAEALVQELETGTSMIDATSHTMTGMMETVSAGNALMQEFVARMAEVTLIVGEISQIARQTNVLALNAAIEAAHAGKQGEGFSVIAQEIRTLADHAATSTTMIAGKITKMDKSAVAAAQAMRAGKEAAAVTIQENEQVQRSLAKIRIAMDEARNRSVDAAEASEKQLAAARNASESMLQVDDLAAELSVEADAAAEMSIKIVDCAEQVHLDLRKRSPAHHLARNRGRRATDSLLKQVQEQKRGLLEALQALRAKCAAAGQPALHGEVTVAGQTLPALLFGEQLASESTDWVDAMRQQSGLGSTIFVLDGTRFVRVATSVKLPNGQRATGTILNPRGVVIGELRRGKAYCGAVYLMGKPFVAAYEPICDVNGAIVGALYVGRPLRWNGRSSRKANPVYTPVSAATLLAVAEIR